MDARRSVRIAMDAREPSFVRRALAELESVLTMEGWQVEDRNATVEVYIGTAAAGTPGWSLSAVRHDGYRLTVTPERIYVAGVEARGTMYGLFALADSWEHGGPPEPCDLLANPVLADRGIYAHTAWIYAHPYALRFWAERDWRDYVDWVARRGLNLLQIWTPVGMMAVPLGSDDRSWLDMIRRVISYAQEERGLRVWVGEAANNVVDEVAGVPFEDREYFRFCAGRMVNPADSAAMGKIAASRAQLYQVLDRADGYWVIDSDPGGWPGSATEDLVRIFAVNARLKADYARADAELIYWMWWGWGKLSPAANWEAAIDGLIGLGEERWRLLVNLEHLPLVLRRDLGPRTLLVPYGAIEGEPRGPYTQVQPEAIARSVGAALAAGLSGCVGNVQTPLTQLPNLVAFTEMMWTRDWDLWDHRRSPAATVAGIAARMFGPWQSFAAAALEAISSQDVGELSTLLDSAPEVPPVAPDAPLWEPARLTRDLLSQLRIRVCVERVRALRPTDSIDTWVGALTAYGEASVAWQRVTHWVHPRAAIEVVSDQPGTKFVVGGRYEPGTGAYGDFLTPVRQGVARLSESARRELSARVVAARPSDEFASSRWEGIFGEVFPEVGVAARNDPSMPREAETARR